MGECVYCNEPADQAYTCAACKESICARCGKQIDGKWYCAKHTKDV